MSIEFFRELWNHGFTVIKIFVMIYYIKINLNVMKTTYNGGIGMPTPEAHITRSKSKNRGKLKIYNNNTVYLDNGEEFEIELFNPTKKTVMAKIEFNGEMISHSGLVLKPAQRVFLERFIDDNRKFKFEVYEIENTQKTKAKADIAKVNAGSKSAEADAREKMNEYLIGRELENNIKAIKELREDSENLSSLNSELNHRANQIDFATKNNGDLKVFFFKEKEIPQQNPYILTGGQWKKGLFELEDNNWNNAQRGTFTNDVWYGGSPFNTNLNDTFGSTTTTGNSSSFNTSLTSSLGDITLDSMDISGSSATAMNVNSLNSMNTPLKSKKNLNSLKRSVAPEEEPVEPIQPREFFSSTNLGNFDLEDKLNEVIGDKIDDVSETGRIGQGGKSHQRFETIDLEFDTFTFFSIEYKIFPTSEKPVDVADLRQYCCSCGKKLKKSDKFCSNCGEQV